MIRILSVICESLNQFTLAARYRYESEQRTHASSTSYWKWYREMSYRSGGKIVNVGKVTVSAFFFFLNRYRTVEMAFFKKNNFPINHRTETISTARKNVPWDRIVYIPWLLLLRHEINKAYAKLDSHSICQPVKYTKTGEHPEISSERTKTMEVKRYTTARNERKMSPFFKQFSAEKKEKFPAGATGEELPLP